MIDNVLTDVPEYTAEHSGICSICSNVCSITEVFTLGAKSGTCVLLSGLGSYHSHGFKSKLFALQTFFLQHNVVGFFSDVDPREATDRAPGSLLWPVSQSGTKRRSCNPSSSYQSQQIIPEMSSSRQTVLMLHAFIPLRYCLWCHWLRAGVEGGSRGGWGVGVGGCFKSRI